MTKSKTMAVCVVISWGGALALIMAAPQAGKERQPFLSERNPRPDTAKSKAQPPLKLMAEYVVEPPDVLVVEVAELLPGPALHRESPVRPDGKISLGFYGEVYVAGLKLPEIKEKIVSQLQQHLRDEQLGLLALDETGKIMIDSDTGKPKSIAPKDSNRVFVGVWVLNSKNYYVQGAFISPARLPITGKERILDAFNLARGLSHEANHNEVYLYREGRKGEPVQTLKIDIDQITMGDDLSTNYQLQPGDRLVAGGGAADRSGVNEREPQASKGNLRPRAAVNDHLDQKHPSPKQPVNDGPEPADAGDAKAALRLLEKRIGEMEHKLDLILEAIKRPVD